MDSAQKKWEKIPSRIPKSRKMFQHVGSRCPSIWGGSLFYLCRVSICPLKNNEDFLTTMVAVGCDVGLMQGESSHFMAFHGDFPISPLFLLRDKAFQGGLEFGVHIRYIWWRCMEWNLIRMNHVWPSPRSSSSSLTCCDGHSPQQMRWKKTSL